MKSLFLFFCLFLGTALGQQPTQNVRGKVFDSESQFPLYRVKVEIFTNDTLNKYRALTNIDGEFEILAVPIGKHQLLSTYNLYDNKSITIEINSGKETVLDIPMVESLVEQEEVVVVGRKKNEVINELALLSAQKFSVSETDRYPGSRFDPARMASNFAGVGGSDDSRNDIVIRGNSPLGVVWKVEGIDIPNPNHFAISGSSGGPVSILNNKILANSDFLMSAFPAEYGNSTSGVFDLKLRNGNNNRHEFTGQFGLLGTEVMAEGPLSKDGKSSYLVMGRYSTLSLFQEIGIQLGTDAIPVYGDGAFKFNWRLKNGGALSFYGIGGASKIDIMVSDQTEYTEDLYGETDRDQYFRTSMFVTGLNYKKPLNEKTFVNSSVAFSQEIQRSNHDYLIRSLDADNMISVDTSYAMMGYDYRIPKASGFYSINHKINPQHLIKAGVNIDGFLYNMIDSVLPNLLVPDVWEQRWNYEGQAMLVQPFVQWKWRSDKMAFTAGLHSQYFSQGNALSIIEPRFGWKYSIDESSSFSAGAGMHSQAQPMYTYFFHQTDSEGNKVYNNDDMDFSRSLHSGIGYEKAFKGSLNLKTEAYYQFLYNVPVTVAPSSFSMINMGSGFSRIFPDDLQNTGTGYNYGLEVTLQKFFDKSFFFLLSATIFDSKYTGSDGVLRNTSYNGTYIANFLAGKEFKLSPKQSISLGFKSTFAGGKRYGRVNIAASQQQQELVWLDDDFNELQFTDYYRIDAKINWKFNATSVTHEIGLDLVNILNTQNLLSLTYAPNLANPSAEPIAPQYQLGFLPIFYYKIDFRLAGGNN